MSATVLDHQYQQLLLLLPTFYNSRTSPTMAANQLRAMYLRIGFTNGADNNIVNVQGIDSVRELGYLNNEDVINLCKTIRRPGGHLPNPAYVTGGAMSATIPYTVIMVSQRAETNIQLASYTMRHHNRISRATNVGNMNPTSIRHLRELKMNEDKRNGQLLTYHRSQELAKDKQRPSRLLQLYSWGDEGTIGLCHSRQSCCATRS